MDSSRGGVLLAKQTHVAHQHDDGARISDKYLAYRTALSQYNCISYVSYARVRLYIC